MTETQRSLAKGLLAGIVAGLAATAAKSLAEKYYAPREPREMEPEEMLAEELTGYAPARVGGPAASDAARWTFGALTGAAYGALAEFYPAATKDEGAAYGLVLMSLTHATALPAAGVSEEFRDESLRERSGEAATHMLFGVVTEKVRSFVRNMMD